MTDIQGRGWGRRLPGRGGFELGFQEQVGFGEDGGLSRLWKDMKGFALSRDGLMVAQQRKSPSCPLLWLKTNTTGRADSQRPQRLREQPVMLSLSL